MLNIFIFILLCFSSSGLTYHPDGLYKDLWECDEFEACSSFVDDNIIKVINRLRDAEENAACEEFHNYALGYFFSKATNDNLFEDIADAFDYEMMEVFNKPLKNDESNSDLRTLLTKMKSFYDQCQQNSKQLTSLSDMIPARFSDWKKVVEELELQGNLNWINYIAVLRNFGLNDLFIQEHIAIAYNDSTRYVVELEIPHFEARSVFYPLLKFPAYNHEQLIGKVRELQSDIVDLISKYRMIESCQNDHKQLITLSELKIKVPRIDWQIYFNTLLQQSNVSDTLPIQLSHLDYFSELAIRLDQTDKKIIAYFILLHLIYHNSGVLRPCGKDLMQQFPIGASYIYDRFIYGTHQKDSEELQRIFSALKVRFSNKISENQLNLSPEEQNYLLEKLNGMTLKLGYLPENQSSSYYNYYYNDAHLTDTVFISNLWEMLRFNVAREHDRLLENGGYIKSKRTFESEDHFKDRAKPYFIRSQNILIVPFEFMRAPFFSHGENALFRHSLTAFALAREIMEAFGPRYIIFDANGNEHEIGKGILRKPSFEKVLKCLRKSDICAYDAEHFADIAGFQLVIDTFFHELPKNGKDARITVEQVEKNAEISFQVRELFFLHLAQYFAGHLDLTLTSDLRAIGKENFDDRLNMIVASGPEFFEVFNCTSDARFNFEISKCKAW